MALDTLHFLSVFTQGRAPELDPIIEARPYQGLVEGKYDISGLICKVPGNLPQNLASLFGILVDQMIISQITRD